MTSDVPAPGGPHEADAAGGTAPGRESETAMPRLDALVEMSARGDRAAFAALYDATAPWVHAMATGVFADAQDAAEATVLTFLTAWDEAGDVVEDLRDHETGAERERAVYVWLEVLAHDVMTRLVRTDSLPGRGGGLLPVAGGLAPVGRLDVGTSEETGHLIDAPEHRTVLWAWLGGRTVAQIADELGVEPATAKAELHRSVRDLVAAHRGRPAPTGEGPRFEIGAGDDRTSLLDHAEIAALDALETDRATALQAALQARASDGTGGTGGSTLWRTRQDAARAAVTWACRSRQAEPPSHLLDELLHRLPAQDLGMDLIDEARASDRRARRPWVLPLVGLLVLAALAAVLAGLLRGDVVDRVDSADDRFHSREVQARDGGVAQAVTSPAEDVGYVRLEGLPQLSEGQAYQVWLHPRDGSSPTSLALRQDDGFADPLPFEDLARFEGITVTVEPDSGAAEPGEDRVAVVPLRPGASGPRFGGMPDVDG